MPSVWERTASTMSPSCTDCYNYKFRYGKWLCCCLDNKTDEVIEDTETGYCLAFGHRSVRRGE